MYKIIIVLTAVLALSGCIDKTDTYDVIKTDRGYSAVNDTECIGKFAYWKNVEGSAMLSTTGEHIRCQPEVYKFNSTSEVLFCGWYIDLNREAIDMHTWYDLPIDKKATPYCEF